MTVLLTHILAAVEQKFPCGRRRRVAVFASSPERMRAVARTSKAGALRVVRAILGGVQSITASDAWGRCHGRRADSGTTVTGNLTDGRTQDECRLCDRPTVFVLTYLVIAA